MFGFSIVSKIYCITNTAPYFVITPTPITLQQNVAKNYNLPAIKDKEDDKTSLSFDFGSASVFT